MEFLECKFSDAIQVVDEDLRLDSQVIPRRESFKYLGSVIQGNGEIDEDVTHRKFYRAVIRPAMLYEAECLPVKISFVYKMKVVAMRILRWMWGHTRLDRIRNEVIRDKVGVAPVEDKMREARLKWFGHVMRRDTDAPVRRCERLALEGLRRSRGKTKKYWGEVIRQDMAVLQLTEDKIMDRKVWKLRIKVKVY
ncbi:PREDICTED: uncharacterized protein LOC109237238 [Nicotiana attenuata]|uniref:uncharacterized protein LOC109237238 n=1 Tax=Nicotiana attenuata TaxID=49451 RepID=UPI000904F7DD|nr:PREDICTED: uncharacterized protein LOC109237238 [Nicotiana attenuata]